MMLGISLWTGWLGGLFIAYLGFEIKADRLHIARPFIAPLAQKYASRRPFDEHLPGDEVVDDDNRRGDDLSPELGEVEQFDCEKKDRLVQSERDDVEAKKVCKLFGNIPARTSNKHEL